jgi:hypothetical protein
VIVRLVLWNLGDADISVAELRRHLSDESVPAFAEVPGLRLKLWVSDEHTDRWGAIYLFESREAADQELPADASELIGKGPDVVEEFDLEASIEGAFEAEMLSRRGLVYEH